MLKIFWQIQLLMGEYPPAAVRVVSSQRSLIEDALGPRALPHCSSPATFACIGFSPLCVSKLLHSAQLH